MVQEALLKCGKSAALPFLEGESIMKKKLLMGGLLPALVMSTCGVAGAQPAAMDTFQRPQALGGQRRII